MDKKEFDDLRDLAGKKVTVDVSFARKQAHRPLLIAKDIIVEDTGLVAVKLQVQYNPETGSKTVLAISNGRPICRLDVDGQVHKAEGRSHKHALETAECPEMNLPEASSRADLAGKDIRDVFEDFCSKAKIDFTGNFNDPVEA